MTGSNQIAFRKVGGFLPSLPGRVADEIARRFPALNVERIGAEFGWYVIERDTAAGTDEPKEIAKRYKRMEKQVSDLRESIEWLQASNTGSLMFHDEKTIEHAGLLEDVNAKLLVLEAVMRRGRRWLPAGRQSNLRHVLTVRLAAIIEKAGFPVDAKPTGPLCQLVDMLLEAAGEKPSNVVEIVKPVLRALKNTG